MTAPMPLGTRVLVMAKMPRPGEVKTRLAASVGADAAAEIAAAALADTVVAAEGAVGVEHCVIALGGGPEGDRAELLACLAALETRVPGTARLAEALSGWRVIPQRGDGLGQRLLAAHTDIGAGPVVQIGMDTPQVTATELREVARGLLTHDAVLAPADDGGWWALGRHDPAHLHLMPTVPMSTPDTGAATVAALREAGARVRIGAALCDVDEEPDAVRVARLVPESAFGRTWHRHRPAPATAPSLPSPPSPPFLPAASRSRR